MKVCMPHVNVFFSEVTFERKLSHVTCHVVCVPTLLVFFWEQCLGTVMIRNSPMKCPNRVHKRTSNDSRCHQTRETAAAQFTPVQFTGSTNLKIKKHV